MCLPWHYRGSCYDICRRNKDHIDHNDEEEERLCAVPAGAVREISKKLIGRGLLSSLGPPEVPPPPRPSPEPPPMRRPAPGQTPSPGAPPIPAAPPLPPDHDDRRHRRFTIPTIAGRPPELTDDLGEFSRVQPCCCATAAGMAWFPVCAVGPTFRRRPDICPTGRPV